MRVDKYALAGYSTSAHHEPHIVTHGEQEVRLFHAIRPMLAQPCRPGDVIALLTSKDLVAENKYDGNRIMIHKDEETVRFFSRHVLMGGGGCACLLCVLLDLCFPVCVFL